MKKWPKLEGEEQPMITPSTWFKPYQRQMKIKIKQAAITACLDLLMIDVDY